MKNADAIMQSACNGCGYKVVLYDQTKEHRPKIRLNVNAIFLES
jgi:hypothetical protein